MSDDTLEFIALLAFIAFCLLCLVVSINLGVYLGLIQ